jgi:alanine racemase
MPKAAMHRPVDPSALAGSARPASLDGTDHLAGGRLTVDLGALAANWRALAVRAGRSDCAAVVKGDGYGIGLEAATRTLAAAGCRTFFAATVAEGLRAKAVVPEAAVHVLNGFPPGAAGMVADAGLRPVLGSLEEVEDWAALGRARGWPLPAALHVDTGMNRLGLARDVAASVAASADLRPHLGLTLLMSHLACADTPDHPLNARQLEAFEAARALFPGVPASLANSAATLALPATHFDLVRPGIAVYGGRAVADVANPMRPVARLEGRIIKIREAGAGESVGYGAAETLGRPSRLAVVGIGYADGFPRAAGSSDATGGAAGWLAGHRVPLVGRVSMDLLVYDVTDVPPGSARRGDWIELFGDHVAVDDVAARAGTIGYEVLTHLGSRFARDYTGAD